MAIYVVHPQGHSVLTVPTKTASMYVEIQADYRTTERQYLNTDLPTTVVGRDPVSWYISGYRHCTNPDWIRSDRSYITHLQQDLESHLTHCVQRRDAALAGNLDSLTPWDFHSWMNAEYQAQGRFYHLDENQPNLVTAPQNVTRRIQLENVSVFNDTVREFSARDELDTHWHNINTEENYPEITPAAADLIRELDDWSHLYGYDLDQCLIGYAYTQAYKRGHVI